MCVNNPPGSHTCSCRDGFRLTADGSTCTGKFQVLLNENFVSKGVNSSP